MIIEPNQLITEKFDICIVGAGIAGLCIAQSFINSHLRILIIEAGGQHWKEQDQQFYQADIVGQNYTGHSEGRYRTFGGSSIRWGGQLLPLTPMDLASRAQTSSNGWPITLENLLPYYKKAQVIMRVNDLPYDKALWSKLGTVPIQFDPHYFQYRYSKWARFEHRNLAKTIGAECISAKNISVLFNSAVVHIQLNPEANKVKHVDVCIEDGRKIPAQAKQYILCGGTLETARLLLASRNVCPTGVGNTHDLVGRYFQDHISFRAAELHPNNIKRFATSFAPTFIKSIMHFPRLEFTPQAQNELNCLGIFCTCAI